VWIVLAASTSSVPFGTRTSTPSIVNVTVIGLRNGR
jgi:hypothetical protein